MTTKLLLQPLLSGLNPARLNPLGPDLFIPRRLHPLLPSILTLIAWSWLPIRSHLAWQGLIRGHNKIGKKGVGAGPETGMWTR